MVEIKESIIIVDILLMETTKEYTLIGKDNRVYSDRSIVFFFCKL